MNPRREWPRWNKASERDELIQDMNTMIQQQSATQAQSGATDAPQPDLHRERLARVKEFDGNDDKFLVEHQQEMELDQREEFTQELKGRVADLLRVRLHEEPGESIQPWAYNRDHKSMSAQIAHTSMLISKRRRSRRTMRLRTRSLRPTTRRSSVSVHTSGQFSHNCCERKRDGGFQPI